MKLEIVGMATKTPELEIVPETSLELLQLVKLEKQFGIRIAQALVPRTLQSDSVQNLALYIPIKRKH